ncbi:MAG: hypothetical protein ACYC5G_03655 [Candidatus Doudnabacteria bacterium]
MTTTSTRGPHTRKPQTNSNSMDAAATQGDGSAQQGTDKAPATQSDGSGTAQ